jgi:hypothetical protein
LASKNNHTAERLQLEPNWTPFFDGVFLDGMGRMVTSPYSTLQQDLRCLHPDSSYSKEHIWIAALIDVFFLPYDSFSIIKDFSTLFCMLFLFFIVEEFISWNWIAVTTKRGVLQLLNFLPVYFMILLGGTFLLTARFGLYFMQFKTFSKSFLNLSSWALGTPKNNLDDGVDLLNDNQSMALAFYFIVVSCVVVILAANIFISIVMEAYSSALAEKGMNYKWKKKPHFLIKRKTKLYQKQAWFRTIFPNTRVPFDRKTFVENINKGKLTASD